jgi:hypothetical protein
MVCIKHQCCDVKGRSLIRGWGGGYLVLEPGFWSCAELSNSLRRDLNSQLILIMSILSTFYVSGRCS